MSDDILDLLDELIDTDTFAMGYNSLGLKVSFTLEDIQDSIDEHGAFDTEGFQYRGYQIEEFMLQNGQYWYKLFLKFTQ